MPTFRPKVFITFMIAALTAAAGCLTPPDPNSSGNASDGYTPVSDFSHIHGLAVNPERPNELYAATHYGLIRGVDDTNWARVGNSEDDFMGFSMHPTNGSTFWSSGHPKVKTVEYHNLGVRISKDGGFTWEEIAMKGVDFHAMAVSPANPDTLWAYAAGKLHRSDDGGYGWQPVQTAATPSILTITPSPAEVERLYVAAGTQGAFKSKDGGSTWERFLDAPATTLAIDPKNPAVMFSAGPAGISKSSDGGENWTPLPLDTSGIVLHLAINPQDPNILYAATAQSAIYKTSDGGATWEVIKPAA